MQKTITEWLTGGSLLLDGGWGTQLQLRGLPVGEHPDLWNLSHPEKVLEVATAYVAAGSDVILTNTFGANRSLLAKHGFENRVAEINKTGVEISKQGANGKAKVFASIGPTGLLLMMGQITEDEMYRVFKEQADAIADANPDGIVVETMSDPTEAAIAVKAAKETGVPVAVSFVFDSGKNKDRTMMGATPEQCVEKMTQAGADIIGANCGQGIDGFIPICERMKAATEKPLWMKANAGLPEIVDGKTIYRQTAEAFAEKAVALLAAGASFIGGCCGTTPEFIAAVRSACRAGKG